MRLRSPVYLIGCGGTGGHLFPGIAVGELLAARGARVVMVVSSKTVDQEVTRAIREMEVWTMRDAQASHGSVWQMMRGGVGFVKSVRYCRTMLMGEKPTAVLGMGGFASAAPVVCGRMLGAKIVLHEANAIPGRVTRWLSRFADEVLLQFEEAGTYLPSSKKRTVGMPVRSAFKPVDSASCRICFGLDPFKPVLTVTGGSQGAESLNTMVLRSLAGISKLVPELQFVHLTGIKDLERVKAFYKQHGLRAAVRPFLTEMEWALGAADVVLSRAGGGSIAECAAMQKPMILCPYPHAADNHQRANAIAYQSSGAAVVVEDQPDEFNRLIELVVRLFGSSKELEALRNGTLKWNHQDATSAVANALMGYASPDWQAASEEERWDNRDRDGAAFTTRAFHSPSERR